MGGSTDTTFEALGSRVRVIIDSTETAGRRSVDSAAAEVEEFIHRFDETLSRFREDSELSRFNSDERDVVPASGLLRTAVRAGLWAAEKTGGLVDPTLLPEIEAAGYHSSRTGMDGLTVEALLPDTPGRHSAGATEDAAWRDFVVDNAGGTISRPPGLGFDPGGTGKGLAADMAAGLLDGFPRFLISCGGDIRVGGSKAKEVPFEVFVEHPATGVKPHLFKVGHGGIATSGIRARSWRKEDGSPAHHLLDPATGEPVWSGLIGTTALAGTAMEAEALAKAALLSGPEGAREILGPRGGILVHEDGEVEVAGSARVRVRLPAIEGSGISG